MNEGKIEEISSKDVEDKIVEAKIAASKYFTEKIEEVRKMNIENFKNVWYDSIEDEKLLKVNESISSPQLLQE